MSNDEPTILALAESHVVVCKPAGMHCAPLREGEQGTLYAWCADRFPEIRACVGRKSVEGGLVHRIDRETEGLVLFARNQEFLDELLRQQEEGLFTKEYRALCTPLSTGAGLEGFPPPPGIPWPPRHADQPMAPFFVQSAFRSYGPGRRAVRPVVEPYRGDYALDRGLPYRTELLGLKAMDYLVVVRARLERGFRHQVRCHLAWLGLPLASDALYGGAMVDGLPFGLVASALEFLDPASGVCTRYEADSKSGEGGRG